MIYNHLELRFIDAGTPNDPDGVELGVFVDESRLGKERWLGLQALRLSCLGDGAYWLFNCDCCEPGCDGIFDPVVAIHRIGGLVVWRVPYKGIAYEGDAPLNTSLYWRGFQFNSTQYIEAIEGFFAPLERQHELQTRLRRCHNVWGLSTPRVALEHVCRIDLAEAARLYRRLESEQIAEPRPGW